MKDKKYSLRIEYVDIILCLCIYKVIEISWLHNLFLYINYALSIIGILFLTLGMIIMIVALKNPKSKKISINKIPTESNFLVFLQPFIIYTYFVHDYKHLAILHCILLVQSFFVKILANKLLKSH